MKSDHEILQFIREAFEKNFEHMRYETGRSLNNDQKTAALIQVLLYWHRLKSIALSVTETEVRLVLPDQETKNHIKYSLQGVVDLVQTDKGTFMYDLKSLDKGAVVHSLDQYRQQLSVYAHIWQGLRAKKLDGAAVIATAVPENIKQQLADLPEDRLYDSEFIQGLIANWDPLVPVDLDASQLKNFIQEFSDIVDSIEASEYSPAPVAQLHDEIKGTGRKFGSLICRKCDARYSCDSYRKFIGQQRGNTAELFRIYWPEDEEDTASVASLLYGDTG